MLSWLFFFLELHDFCDWQPHFEIMWALVQITYLVEYALVTFLERRDFELYTTFYED